MKIIVIKLRKMDKAQVKLVYLQSVTKDDFA